MWWFTAPLVFGLALLDWLTPAGIVVGLLLAVPVVLSSLSDRPAEVWSTFVAAVTAFLLAGTFGREPVTPESVWIPNRLLALAGLIGSGLVARVLQRRSLAAAAGAREATRLSHVNQLLTSLMAHDLRAPLGLAIEVLELSSREPAGHVREDRELLRDVVGRLRRSVTTVDQVLTLTQRRLSAGLDPGALLPRAEPGAIVEAEVAGFRVEAESRGTSLELVKEPEADRMVRLDPLLLRQGVAVLVDNALRHAAPGTVRISVTATTGRLMVSVSDSGPGLSTGGKGETDESGLGIALQLLGRLLEAGGGRLHVVRDSPAGTTFAFVLPLEPA